MLKASKPRFEPWLFFCETDTNGVFIIHQNVYHDIRTLMYITITLISQYSNSASGHGQTHLNT